MDMVWSKVVSTAKLVMRDGVSEMITGDPLEGYVEELPSLGVPSGCIWVMGTWNRSSGQGVVSTA